MTIGILGASAAIVFVPREATLRDPTVPGQTGALVWGDGVFSNALELQAWLRVRGVAYREWARKHPAAVELLAPKPPGEAAAPTTTAAKPAPKPAPKAASKPAAKKAPKPASKKAPAASEAKGVATTAPGGSADDAGTSWRDRFSSDSLFPVLLGLLVLLGALVAVWLSRTVSSTSRIGYQLGFVASALSVAIGLALASLLS